MAGGGGGVSRGGFQRDRNTLGLDASANYSKVVGIKQKGSMPGFLHRLRSK